MTADDALTANDMTATMAPDSRSKPFPWIWLIKFTLGLALLISIFSFFDFREVARRIGSANLPELTVAVGLSVLQYVVFAFRWRYLAACAGANLPATQAIIGNFELAFVSQLVPSAVAGDAVRIVRARRIGLTLAQSFISVFLDRLIGLATIVFLAPLTVLLAPKAISNDNLLYMMLGLGVIFAAGLAILYFTGPILSSLFGESRVVRALILISDALRTIVHSARFASFAVGASIVGYALAALAINQIARAISIPLEFLAAMPALCLMTLAALVPVSIGGWGVREGAALIALELFAVSAEDALTISILYGLAGTVVGVVGGIVWMFSDYKRASVA